jgi:hypothetical protein
MFQYSFVARGADGNVHKGSIEAADAATAKNALQEQYADVLDIVKLDLPLGDENIYTYLPLVTTLRMYCGWILVFLLPLYGIGVPLLLRKPGTYFFSAWIASEVFKDIACTAFLFLLGTSLHRLVRGEIIMGLFLTICGLAVLLCFLQFT